MNLQSGFTSCDVLQIGLVCPLSYPCKRVAFSCFVSFCRREIYIIHRRKLCIASSVSGGAKNTPVKTISGKLDGKEVSQGSVALGTSKFTNFREDPIVDKLRTQLGVVHTIPLPPFKQNIVGLFVFFFFVGVVFDKVWTGTKKKKSDNEGRHGMWPQVPTSFSLFLEKDLQRKESVEWVNMVLGKLWKVYKLGLENWFVGLLQPVIDNIKKPDYVKRVEIQQFSLGDEPLSVRNVERITSRRVNDLQYQIGLRYTGGARMLLKLSLNFGIIPIVVPVGVRDFDIDGELWVKLRLIPSEPWVGAVSWAFVSLPKIKVVLSPFRLFNVMAIPVLSKFLTKLLTEDLPRLFVRPRKSVLDFQKGKAVGPVSNDFMSEETKEEKKDCVGELSVTLVDARKLSYVFSGKTDPYVILRLGDQVIRSKKNSQTSVFGSPGKPIWNQVALGLLEDTVPTDKIVSLLGGWRPFGERYSGEILLRLTYKAYVEDDEEENTATKVVDTEVSDDEMFDYAIYEQPKRDSSDGTDKESFMDVLATLLVSEEFQGIVASETGNTRSPDDVTTTVSSSAGTDTEQVSPNSVGDNQSFIGSSLFWLAVITTITISVLFALNVDDGNLFNP